MLDFGNLLILFGASFFAGFINSIVGSGTLITFPTLLLFGVNPIVANASNNLGLVPGAISAAIATRKDFQNFANRRFLNNLIVSAVLGSLIGSLLLLVTSIDFLEIFIPILIIFALITLWSNKIFKNPKEKNEKLRSNIVIAAGLGTYGGYFGAAQGIMWISYLQSFKTLSIYSANAIKNFIAGIVNTSASIIFLVFGKIDWQLTICIGVGSAIGASVGPKLSKRLSPTIYRIVITIVALTALVWNL